MRDLEIVIPAYNEEDNIGGVIEGIRQILGNDLRITVVDDASEDKTAEIARAGGAIVLQHPYRLGNGACIKTGLRNAAKSVVVLMDGDGQHLPQDIPKLLEHIEKFDMVVGARDFSKVSLRNFGNIFYNSFASYITQAQIRDLTSGFRVVKRNIFCKFLYLFPNGFSYPTTSTLALLKTGRTIKYVTIQNSLRKAGKSKISLASDGVRFCLIIARVATFFSPLRFFLPVSLLFFMCGLLYYLYTYLSFHRFTNMSALLFTTSVIIFMLGLVSEQISQLRMDRTED